MSTGHKAVLGTGHKAVHTVGDAAAIMVRTGPDCFSGRTS